MSKVWEIVSLEKVIKHRKEFIEIDESKEYKRCRVKLHVQGIELRDIIQGSAIKTKKQQLCKTNDFLVAEIDAKVGGFGIVPENLDGAIVSNHYFLFEVDNRLDKGFFEYFIRTPDFRDQVIARGSTNYAAIRPRDVLAYQIHLPPLEEQRRLVARIEELAVKVEEARGLRWEAVGEVEALFASASEAVFNNHSPSQELRIGDFCESPQYGYTESSVMEPVGPKFLRITDIQNGRVNWETVPYCRCTNPEKYLLKKNDILFARTGATTGKSFLIHDCPEAIFASYLIRLRIKHSVTPDYLYKYFQTPSYWSQIMDEKKGTGQPNMNGKKLSQVRVPMVSSKEQHRIVEYLNDLQAKVEAVKKLQADTEAELEALLPAILEKAFRGEL
jgi:type I restriction enzyme S subunit